MKITTPTANELELKEGSATGMILGAAFMIASVLVALFGRHSAPIMLYIGVAAAIGGVVGILLASSITVRANKSTGQLSYEKRRLIGAQNATYAISDVFRIETRKQWRMQSEAAPNNQGQSTQQPVLVAQSVIVFNSGQELPLDHQKNSSTTQIGGAVLMSGQGGESAMAAQVARFLNVPFQEIAPPNMGGGINIIAGQGF
jgi:hypothetical protein